MKASIAASPEQFDITRQWVRITGKRDDGFIEFDFSVGEPEVLLEMVLKEDDFKAFCHERQVAFLKTIAETGDKEVSPWDWRLHDATHHFRDA